MPSLLWGGCLLLWEHQRLRCFWAVASAVFAVGASTALAHGLASMCEPWGLRGFGAGASPALVTPGPPPLCGRGVCCYPILRAPPLWRGGLCRFRARAYVTIRTHGARVCAVLGLLEPPRLCGRGQHLFLDRWGLHLFGVGAFAVVGTLGPPPFFWWSGPRTLLVWAATPLRRGPLLLLGHRGLRCFGATALPFFRHEPQRLWQHSALCRSLARASAILGQEPPPLWDCWGRRCFSDRWGLRRFR